MTTTMMIWFGILLTLAIVFLLAEVFVPSAGLLGVLGLGCLLAAVIVCFFANRWLGAGVSIGLLVISPFAINGALRIWQRTPIGKKMILTQTTENNPQPTVLVGSSGVALTELRPMGECEFGDTRLDAQSEMGQVIPAGAKVKVISVSSGVATVRLMA